MTAGSETPTLSLVGSVMRIEADGSTAEVRVLRADGPSTILGDLTGSIIHIVLPPERQVEAGHDYRFDAVAASYGERIVLRAVDVRPPDTTPGAAASPRVREALSR